MSAFGGKADIGLRCPNVLLVACTARAAAVDSETCFKETGDVAIAACTRLIESGEFTGNGLAAIYFNRGVTWYEMGNYDRAIQDYNEAIKLNPNFEQAFFNRGNAFDEHEQFDRAIQDYDRAIALKPDYAKAFNNRGISFTKKGQYDRAIQDYDQAIKLEPEYAEALNNRGTAYFGKREYDHAIQDYEEAIKLNPSFAQAFYNRGVTKLTSGDTDGGNADIDAAKRINPAIVRQPKRRLDTLGLRPQQRNDECYRRTHSSQHRRPSVGREVQGQRAENRRPAERRDVADVLSAELYRQTP